MYLTHHGIKGQEWGVKHGPPYPLDDTTQRKIKKKSSIKTKKQESIEAKYKKASINRSKLSAEELRDLINRHEQEIRLRELTEKNLHPGRQKVKEILKSSGGKVLGTVLTGAALYGAKLLVSGKIKEAKTEKGMKEIRGGLADAMFNGGPKKK